MLVLKQTIPHMKALIFSFLELDGQGRGTIMVALHQLAVKTIFWSITMIPQRKGLMLESLRVWHNQEGIIYFY